MFVYDPDVLANLHAALSRGNKWAELGSMIIAVFTKSSLDCIVKERQYYLFDSGMATAFLMLRATELDLVVHPIAGYDEQRFKRILAIPDDMTVITLLIVGKHSEDINPILSDEQKSKEEQRPERRELNQFVHLNNFKEKNE